MVHEVHGGKPSLDSHALFKKALLTCLIRLRDIQTNIIVTRAMSTMIDGTTIIDREELGQY